MKTTSHTPSTSSQRKGWHRWLFVEGGWLVDFTSETLALCHRCKVCLLCGFCCCLRCYLFGCCTVRLIVHDEYISALNDYHSFLVLISKLTGTTSYAHYPFLV
jgi:hypothetical protein